MMRREVPLWIVLVFLLLAACGEIPEPSAPSPQPSTPPGAIVQPSPSPEVTATVGPSPPPPPTVAPDSSLQTLLYFAAGGTYRQAIDPQTLVLSKQAVLPGYGVEPGSGFHGAFPSSDGRYVALYLSHEGGEGTTVIDVALGTTVELVLMGMRLYDTRYLNWTPQDDLLIVLMRVGPGLWRLNIRQDEGHFFFGSGECAPCYVSAAVSPDGQTVVYSYSRSIGQGSKVWKMNADGSGKTLLLVEPDLIIYGLSFSPDGSRIAYATIPDSAASYPPAKVWVMNADGSSRRLLSEQADGGHGYRPYWSPDGRYLAFTSREGADPDRNNIHIVEVETGAERELLPLEGQHNYDPCWSPDGTRLVFVSDRSGADEVWVVNADGTGLQQLTDDGLTKRFPLWLRPWWRISFLPWLQGYLGAAEGGVTHRGRS